MLPKLILVFCLVSSTLSDSQPKPKPRWAYEDQYNWPQSCRGQYQSPIDLPDICYPKSVNNITIDSSMKYDPQGFNQLLPYQRMRILNNGHTVSLTVDGWDSISDYVPSIALNVARGRIQYQFFELHFHWAQDNTQGSEHSIAGSRKALEMHLVHFNKRYPNKDIAASQADGLLVLGVLFHEDTMVNPTLDPIVDQLQYVRRTNYSAPARRSFTLQSLLPPDISIYYMYKGSLTTPPCSESVTWLIIAEVQKVGYSQLKEFQTMDSSGDRNRDIQERNGRPIYANSNTHCSKDSNQGYGPGSSENNNGGGFNNNNNNGGYNPDNGYGNSGYGGGGSGWNNRPQGNNDGYGSGRPQGQGNDGYGNGRPQPGSDSWGSGRPPPSTGYGSGSNADGSSPSSGGYRPQGSGGISGSGGDQGWDQKPQPGSSGYGSSGYGSQNGNSGYGNRPDSGYASNSGSYGNRPGSSESSRPSSGQSGGRMGPRPPPRSGHSHKRKRHHKIDRELTGSDSGEVVPPVSQ